MSIRKCKASGVHPRSQFHGDTLDRDNSHRASYEVRATCHDPSIQDSDYLKLLSPETLRRLQERER